MHYFSSPRAAAAAALNVKFTCDSDKPHLDPQRSFRFPHFSEYSPVVRNGGGR